MRRGLTPRAQARGRAAVLALDVITDFEFPDGPAVRRALARRVDPIRGLLAKARAHSVPVVYANDNIGEWRSDSQALIARCTRRDRPGAALIAALRPQPRDYIVLKPRHSAFFGTPLVPLLDDLRVDTLVVVGISAEMCVWMTACDAHTRGYPLIVPADCVAGASAPALRMTLGSLGKVLGARTPAHGASLRFSRGRVG